MSICCRVCNTEFPNLISSSHLKKHNMLTQEYVAKYGKNSLASDEYRQRRSISNTGANNPNYGNTMSDKSREKISNTHSGKVAWNKGKKYDDTSVQQAAAAKRESDYASGKLKRAQHVVSKETRQKISDSVLDYARNHSDEIKERAVRAIQTKRDNGNNLATFRGKFHTPETKVLISEKSKLAAQLKTERSVDEMTSRLTALNFSISAVTLTHISATCNVCNTEVSYTKQMFQPAKIREDLCAVCSPRTSGRSKLEIEVFEYINSLLPATPTYKFDNTRRSIDVYVPSKNIGFEFNGLYWHSEEVLVSNGNSKIKDFKKLQDVTATGIRLIQIFEDEWVNSGEIVKSRISNILGIARPAVYARKCEVREITPIMAASFCKKYHLQGAGRSNIRIGLFYKNELVSVMTFSKNNISRKISAWELNRFCSANVNVPGGASRLFSHFVKLYSPDTVISYADRRWSNGNVYTKIGFVFDKFTTPGYWYLKDNFIKRIHRYSLRKQREDPADVTERALRMSQGYKTIWDSGNSKWIWDKPTA